MAEKSEREKKQEMWGGLFLLALLFIGFPAWCVMQNEPDDFDRAIEAAINAPGPKIKARPAINPAGLRAGIDELKAVPIVRKVWWTEGYEENGLPKVGGDNTLRVGVRDPKEIPDWDRWAQYIGCGILSNFEGDAGVDLIVYDPTPDIIRGRPIGYADCDK